MKKTLLTLAAAVLCSGSAFASGYQVLLQSNRSTAMGNIGVGLRPDPSAINFNPGALAMMRGNGVQLGANLIYSKVAYKPFNSGVTYNMENETGTPFHFFAAFGGDDSPLKFGIGVYTPFGSSVKWEDGWAGRFDLTELSLRAIYIQPTLSYQLSEKFSVGAGLIYSTGGVNLKRDIAEVYLQDGEYGSSELDGSASGWGYNLGAYFVPNEKLSIGLNYRSRIDMKVEDGNATFTKSPLVPDAVLPSETGFKAELPLPSSLTLGVAYQANEKFMVGLDVARVQWSAYQELKFTFDDPVVGSTEQVAKRNYESSYVFRLGGEYAVNDMFTLRAGGYYDQTPVKEGFMTPETPDANAIGLTGGFGLHLTDNFTIDTSFLFIDKEERDNPVVEEAGDLPTGTYKTYAFIPGLSLTYKF